MKTILITGINGVVGQIVASRLSQSYSLYGLDSRGPFSPSTLHCDIGNFDELFSALSTFSPTPSVIVHLAAASDHLAPWDIVLKNNISGTHNLYESARQLGVQRVIFPSSTHAFGQLPGYPNLDFLRLPLETTYQPDSDYGVSKVYGEGLARYYSDAYGLSSIILRIGSVTATDIPEPGKEKIHLYQKDLLAIIDRALNAVDKFQTVWAVSENEGKL